MNKVAVTGAGGFIGSHLVKVLKKNKQNKVKLLSHKKNSLFDIKILTNFVKDQNLIFHLAGINDPNSSDIFKVNVLGTINLLEAMRISGTKARLVYTSTFSVYKLPSKRDIVSEKFKISPSNAYGISKRIAEEIITFYSKTYGLKASVARLSNVYGPNMPPFKHSVVSTLIALAKTNKEMILTGNGSQTRDFIYVDDAVSGLLALSKAKGTLVLANICTGVETSLNAVVKEVNSLSRKENRVKYVKAIQSNLGYWKGTSVLFRRPFNWAPKITFSKGMKKIW